MDRKLIATLALAGLLAAGAVAGTAAAASDNEDREATALQNAKVSLAQAIATAEQRTGGQAYDAGVDAKNGQARIVVETNGPKGVHTVSIDAQSGHVGGEED